MDAADAILNLGSDEGSDSGESVVASLRETSLLRTTDSVDPSHRLRVDMYGFELVLENSSLKSSSSKTSPEKRAIRPVQPARQAVDWLRRLLEAADREGVACYVNDEFGTFKRSVGEDSEAEVDSTLRAMGLFDPSRLVRMDPLGYVRTGHEILTEWDATRARRWDPKKDNAVDIAGFRGLGPKDQATSGTLQR